MGNDRECQSSSNRLGRNIRRKLPQSTGSEARTFLKELVASLNNGLGNILSKAKVDIDEGRRLLQNDKTLREMNSPKSRQERRGECGTLISGIGILSVSPPMSKFSKLLMTN